MGSPLPVIIAVYAPSCFASRAALRKFLRFISGSFGVMPFNGVIFDMQNGHRALHAELPATILNVWSFIYS